MSWTVDSVVPSTGWAVPLESIDSVEGIGGRVEEDNNEVRECVGLGDDSEDKMIEGVSATSTIISTTDIFVPNCPWRFF